MQKSCGSRRSEVERDGGDGGSGGGDSDDGGGDG